jgi:hypothetical protein
MSGAFSMSVFAYLFEYSLAVARDRPAMLIPVSLVISLHALAF